jgi:hypothetical protein
MAREIKNEATRTGLAPNRNSTAATGILVTVIFLTLSLAQCMAERYTIDVPDGGFTNRAGRVRFATDLLQYLAKIDTGIPNIHPREEDWLAREKERVMSMGRTAMSKPRGSNDSSGEVVQWALADQSISQSKEQNIVWARQEIIRFKQSLTNILSKGYLRIPTSGTNTFLLPDTDAEDVEAWVRFQRELLASDLHDYLVLLSMKGSFTGDWTLRVGDDVTEVFRSPTVLISAAISYDIIMPFVRASVTSPNSAQIVPASGLGAPK